MMTAHDGMTPDARRLLQRVRWAGSKGIPAVTSAADCRGVDELKASKLIRWDNEARRWFIVEPVIPAPATTRLLVVELIDEDDDLVGYGVCVETTTKTPEGDDKLSHEMKPEVYGVRSEAHAYIARASGRELRS